MENVSVRFIPMPTRIKSYVIVNPDGFFTIVLNSNLSWEQNKKSYAHEIQHIQNGDFERQCSADIIEIFAHEGSNL